MPKGRATSVPTQVSNLVYVTEILLTQLTRQYILSLEQISQNYTTQQSLLC